MKLFSPGGEDGRVERGRSIETYAWSWNDGHACHLLRPSLPGVVPGRALERGRGHRAGRAGPDVRQAHWRALVIARAIENQCVVLGVNRVGDDPPKTTLGVGLTPGLHYGGGTIAVGPRGEVLGELGDEAGVLSVPVEAGSVRGMVGAIPGLAGCGALKWWTAGAYRLAELARQRLALQEVANRGVNTPLRVNRGRAAVDELCARAIAGGVGRSHPCGDKEYLLGRQHPAHGRRAVACSSWMTRNDRLLWAAAPQGRRPGVRHRPSGRTRRWRRRSPGNRTSSSWTWRRGAMTVCACCGR